MNPLVLPAGLLLAIGYYTVAAGTDCCYKKTLGGAEHTLLESGSSEVSAYGCDAPGLCIYKDPAGDRVCFKMGGTDVPACGCTDVLLVRPDDKSVEIWNPDGAACSNTTAQLPDLPKQVGEGLRAAFVNDQDVYVCCGDAVTESCYILNTTNPVSWVKKYFNHNAKFHSLTKIDYNGNILLASGGRSLGTSSFTNKIQVMTSGGAWSTLRGYELKSAMERHCEVSNGTHLWVIGGEVAAAVYTDAVSMLDIAGNTWVDLTPLPKAVRDAACVYDNSQDKIYVAAGKDFYCMDANGMETLPVLPSAIEGGGYSMAIVNGKVTLFGGMDGSNQKSSAVHAFDMGTWNVIGNLSSTFSGGNAIKLAP